jgi:thiamine pyrophosphokinase
MSDPVLVANAPLSWTPGLAALAAAAEPLLAADGGADHLAAIGLRPAAVIGDLDSISDQSRGWIGEDRLVSRPNQDRTDLDKALEYAFEELGLARLTVLAAVGGRVDHELGNLGVLARHGRGEALRFVSAHEVLIAVRGRASLAAEPGETWSFWCFDREVLVTIGGVRWPVEDEPLDLPRRPSLSNVAVGSRVEVATRGGSVVVMRASGARGR